MKIIKDKNNFDFAQYEFNVNNQILEGIRTYTIISLDPFINKNKTVIGEIILRGYNVKLDEIEEKLLKIFKEGN